MPRGRQFDVGERLRFWPGILLAYPWRRLLASLRDTMHLIGRWSATTRPSPRTPCRRPPRGALGAPESCNTGTRRGSTITSFNFRSRRPRSFKAEVPGCEKLSVRQIQLICQKRLGLPSRCASKKPLLMAKMVKKRLAFCKKYRKWTEKN